MPGLRLKEIVDACNGQYYGEESLLDSSITNVVTDSRQAGEGSLFAAIPGERVDGHRFIPDVFAKGALAVLCEREVPDAAGPCIRVESSLMAIRQIAAYYRSKLTIPVIGITGSVGKTSTKEMIAAVLEQKYSVLKTEGNFNNLLGMPMTLLKIRSEHEVAVVEMGISEFGEMHQLAEIARPDICVITNIGQAHLENLKSRDGILKAKTEIFDFLKEDATIILNGNDDKLSLVGEVKGITPRRYYVEDNASAKEEIADVAQVQSQAMQDESRDVRITNIVNHGLTGMEADLTTDAGTIRISEPIPGAHNLYNAGAAACVGRVLGLSNDEIAAGIASAKTIAGRLNMIRLNDNIVVIDDCYNANPASMKASLSVLSLAEGRTIAVLGDMGELGEKEKALHAEVGEAVAANGIDVLFCAGELSAEMAKAAQETVAFQKTVTAEGEEAAQGKVGSGTEVHYYVDRNALIQELTSFVRPGDSILVKASHFMAFPEVVEALKNTFTV